MINDSKDIIELRKKFRLYYDSTLQFTFASLESLRVRCLLTFLIMFVLIFIALPLALYFYVFAYYSTEQTFNLMANVPVEVYLFGAVGASAILALPRMFYKRAAKGKIMEPFIGFFGSFSYKTCNKIDDYVLSGSKLFPSMDGSDEDDFFCGKYKDVEITISEEKVYQIVRTKKGTRKADLFRGVLILLDMNKKFDGQTVVKKDRGWLLNRFMAPGLNKVALEDVEFEKNFEVFSDNQIEARYLLTTAFMERMLHLRDYFKSKSIEFSFFDNKLLVALKCNMDMFEPSSIFVSSTSYKHIEAVFDQFCAVFSVIDVLKLDKKAVL